MMGHDQGEEMHKPLVENQAAAFSTELTSYEQTVPVVRRELDVPAYLIDLLAALDTLELSELS